MAATLKICLMVHVEDTESWFPVAQNATRLGSFAEEVAKSGRGAKVSVQFGRNFLDANAALNPYPLGAGLPTPLQTVLYRGGNFWTHTHSAAYSNLVSNYSCVRSAYQNEGGATYPAGGPGGRSGGSNESGLDWVSITQQAGIRVMNSAPMVAHYAVPLSARPYGFTNDEIGKLYPKGQAPGPLDADVMTMRQRPFWMDVASNWFARTDTIYPSASYVGSVLMIPGPGKLDLPGLSEGRTAFSNAQLTEDDFKCALSQAWKAYENMATYQSSITNAWYTHMPFNQINDSTTSMMGNFVDSLNAAFDLSGTPKAAWKNMNEIASLFSDTASFNS